VPSYPDAHVPGAPAAPTATAPAPTTTAQQQPGGYTVQPGDNLYAIAATHHVDDWQQLYQHNLPTVGQNPNLIFPGQQLQLP
jgi:LysM repeat protein